MARCGCGGGLASATMKVVRSIPVPATVLFEPGFRFDGYELLVKIGQGGMASVWLARTKNARDEEVLVAVKTVLPELAAVDDLKSMMLDEAKIAMAISSRYVAGVLAVGEVWDIPYLVLEYVAGESVDQLCEGAKARNVEIPPAIVARILVDTARGLHTAHELRTPSGDDLGIVHRDLSPQNVLLDERGHVKLIDFGIAKVRERITPETAEGVMKGKIPFMAPEHAMGGDVDRRSDLWALGAVAYVMLSGKEPHEGSNDAARLIKKLARDPIPPLPASTPKALADAVMKLLAHSPDDRFATAKELADTLDADTPLATHEEVSAFVSETLAETIRGRQLLVERAVAAARARARARDMLSNPDMPAYTGEIAMTRATPAPSRAPEGSPSPEGTLSLPPPAEPASRPWIVYASAAAIALAVVLAYAVGASSSRGPATSSTGSAGTTPSLVAAVKDAAPSFPIAAPTSSALVASASASASASAASAPSASPSTSASAVPSTTAAAIPSAKPLILPVLSTTGGDAGKPAPSAPTTPIKPPEETIF